MKNEVTQLKEDYDSAASYMMDYKMGILGQLIERKLGLKKRSTKAEQLINGYIYDIGKELRSKSKDHGIFGDEEKKG